jgi:hypothetical protein
MEGEMGMACSTQQFRQKTCREDTTLRTEALITELILKHILRFNLFVCSNEMDFWRSARKSRKEKVRNVTTREIMEVGKNILEVIEKNGYDGLDM